MIKSLLFYAFALIICLNAQKINFAVIGDYGCDCPDELKVSEFVKSKNPDFILTTGDNNYKLNLFRNICLKKRNKINE